MGHIPQALEWLADPLASSSITVRFNAMLLAVPLRVADRAERFPLIPQRLRDRGRNESGTHDLPSPLNSAIVERIVCRT